MNESAALLCAGGRTYVVAAALQTREWEARRQVWDACLAHLERYKKKILAAAFLGRERD